eukprot:289631-Amphidinium_carterae.1
MERQAVSAAHDSESKAPLAVAVSNAKAKARSESSSTKGSKAKPDSQHTNAISTLPPPYKGTDKTYQQLSPRGWHIPAPQTLARLCGEGNKARGEPGRQ